MGGSEAPLQIAVARGSLLGAIAGRSRSTMGSMNWSMATAWCRCLAGGEPPAAERLRTLLGRAYGDTWSPQLLERLLAEAGSTTN